jgi:hypothetical protein
LNEVLPEISHKFVLDANQKNLLPLLNLANSGGKTK